MSLDPRAWARTLGPVGAWSFDVERLGAEEARTHARDLEALNVPVLWIPESLGSKEVFAHASLLLGATKRLIIATGIANIWARDPVAMANGRRRSMPSSRSTVAPWKLPLRQW